MKFVNCHLHVDAVFKDKQLKGNSITLNVHWQGTLRVYKKLKKCYPCVNSRTGNHMVRAHADGYHCFLGQENEFHRYAMYNNVSLPSPLSPDSDSDEDDQHTYYRVGALLL